MFEYVEDYGLKFSGALTPRKKTVRIIEHHTSGGPGETVQGIHAYHLGNGHKGIDYNFCVLADGTVVRGRGLEYCGGSVNNSAPRSKGMNNDSVAVAALGDFEHNEMPAAQKEGLKRITRDVARYYGIAEIIRHKDVSDTDCPGRYFPFDEIKAYALGREEPKPMPNRTEVEAYVDRLYRKVLDREPDAAGRTYHINELMNRRTAPAQTGYSFYFGTEEMKTREANEEFVCELYRGLLGREADAAGKENWLKRIYKDMSREALFHAFVASAEFKAVEKQMGF